LSGQTWLFLGLSGLATGASWVCYFRALQLGEVSKVAPVDKLSLVLVAVFAVLFLGSAPGCGNGWALAWWHWVCWCWPSAASLAGSGGLQVGPVTVPAAGQGLLFQQPFVNA
jgi:hypothetical protein